MSIIPIELREPSADGSDGVLKIVNGSNNWFVIDHSKKTAKVWIFGVISGLTRYSKLLAMIHSLTKDYVLHVYIHSPGGEIPIAANLISAMAQCEAKVVTHNIGLAASCGSLILCCGDEIEVCDNTATMFHSSGMNTGGITHRVISSGNHLIKYVNMLFDKMKSTRLLTEEEYIDITTNGAEYYFTSTEMNNRLNSGNLKYQGGNHV